VVPVAEKDAVTRMYMKNNDHFADAVNFCCFDGRSVVQPENLHALDSSVAANLLGKNGKKKTEQRFRDLLKMAEIKYDDKAVYLMVGIENQSEIDRSMAVRTMLSDSLQYMMQIERIKKNHQKNHDKPEDASEYMSGFYRDDKLLPVITLTVYFGGKSWDAPTDLYSMLDASPEILRLVDNYHLHLIDPHAISNENFGKFRTELRNVMKFVKFSNNKSELVDMMNQDETFHNISWDTANTINVVTGSKLKLPEREERVDMCKAIEQIRNDSVQEGELNRAYQIAKRMLERGKNTVEEIAEDTGLPIETIRELAGEKSA
jgi:hypothetical protein